MYRDDVKVLAFDLDGTLSQHRSPIDPENRKMLEKLSEKYRLLIVGAGQVQRIFDQIGHFPMDILGNYGMQYGEVRKDTGILEICWNETLPCDRESISIRMEDFRLRHGFTEFKGDGVEFHPTGCVTLAILGTKADISDKLRFDPEKSIRRALYAEVAALFPEYNVYIGGSSSFDMSPRPYDKAYALKKYCTEKEIPLDAVHYFGDDYGPGGNDEAVFLSGIHFNKVDDFRSFPGIAQKYL